MKSFWKKILQPYKNWQFNRQTKSLQTFSYKGVTLTVLPGVFSPNSTYSTQLFVDYLSNIDLKDKKVLELGAGSGLISFYCAQKGAIVSASDISHAAIEGLHKNKNDLNLPISIVKSNFFESIDGEFDYIFVNPPFFPKHPRNPIEETWCCGSQFEFYEAFFSNLLKRSFLNEKIYVILNKEFDIERINRIGLKNYFRLEAIKELKRANETYIINKVVESD